ncbi:hypothetical protein Tco_1058283 [Tanacetum coccineum]|uniref:Uncharacterized protein n=1 Tax=Tanacetum coccineum TaxID=301880 RepID=A0ABQ5H7W7_9ASTR
MCYHSGVRMAFKSDYQSQLLVGFSTVTRHLMGVCGTVSVIVMKAVVGGRVLHELTTNPHKTRLDAKGITERDTDSVRAVRMINFYKKCL